MAVMLLTEEHFEKFYPYVPEEMIPLLRQQETIAVGAVEDETGIPTGILMGTFWSYTLHIEWLFVGEQFRRNGIAMMLISYLTFHARNSAEVISAEFGAKNWEMRRLFQRSLYKVTYETRPLYCVTLGEMRNHVLLKSFRSGKGVVPLSEAPPLMLEKFSHEMERSSAPVETPINVADYSTPLSYVCVDGQEIIGCLLMQETQDGLHLAFAYAKKTHSHCLPMLICVVAHKALELYPDNTTITLVAVEKNAAALVQKIFGNEQPMERCAATFAY